MHVYKGAGNERLGKKTLLYTEALFAHISHESFAVLPSNSSGAYFALHPLFFSPPPRNRPCATTSGAQQIQHCVIIHPHVHVSRRHHYLLLHTTDFFLHPPLYPLMTVYGGNSWRTGNETPRNSWVIHEFKYSYRRETNEMLYRACMLRLCHLFVVIL